MPQQGDVKENPQECSPGAPSRLWAEQLTLYRLKQNHNPVVVQNKQHPVERGWKCAGGKIWLD